MPLFSLETLPSNLQSAAVYRNIPAGELLYHQGEPSHAVFFLMQGRMRLDNHIPGKGTIPLYVIRPGECVSEAALFADRYCSDAVAEISSRVFLLPKAALQRALDENSRLARDYMTLQSERFHVIRRAMEIRSIRLARERVLRYLFVSKPAGSSRLWMDRPLRRMADDVGLTHETFYRTMKELEQDGSICWSGNAIVFGHTIVEIAS